MDSFDLSEQRIVQLEQIPGDIRYQIERGDSSEYALDLSLNRLRSIDQIGVFQHVSQLDLSGNQLENVNGIQTLRHLQSLDLSRNCISSVDLLALLPALQILKVAENSLTTIDSLQLLPELRVVDASYNRITKWPSLAGLSLLETLDLSGNMLAAFSSSLSVTLFPSRLRRLSIARNQIDKLCGVACLGLQLPILEFLAFDKNPTVLEVARSGGQLERLLAAFFPSVPLSNDGGLIMSGRRHEELSILPHTLNILKRAILEGNEEVLHEFLVTGTIALPEIPGQVGGVVPPPPPIERMLPNRRQHSLDDATDDQSAVDNSLSHDNKLEIWKRFQEDRKAQFSQSNGFEPSCSEVKREKSVKWGHHSVVSAPVEDGIRKPALTTADLDVSDPIPHVMTVLDVSSFSVMKPLDSTFSESIKNSSPPNAVEYEALVKKLTDQVTTMRKYMKVWIKREKMVRDTSARKIQRWFRRVQRKFQLRHRILRSRSRRQDEYGFRHCSSMTMQNGNYRGVTQARLAAGSAEMIQSHARGFIIRQRMKSFRTKQLAASKIQRIWREVVHDRKTILHSDWKISSQTGNKQSNVRWHGVVRGMIRCARDVKQLQQVCVVQDDAISYLWENQVCSDSVDKANPEKKLVRSQRLWRGQSPKKQPPHEKDSSPETYPANVVDEMKNEMDRQSLEINQLKQQLQTLQILVAIAIDLPDNSSLLHNPIITRSSKNNFFSTNMGNISSCYKPSKLDPCMTPVIDDNQVPKSDASYEIQVEKVDQPVSEGMPKEEACTPDSTTVAISRQSKPTFTFATPLLSTAGASGAGGNYGDRR